MLPRAFYIVIFGVLLVAVFAALPNPENLYKPTTAYTDTAPFANDVTDVNVSMLLNALGTPLCMKQCTMRFARRAKELLAYKNTLTRMQNLCNAFTDARACLDTRPWCGLQNIFDTVVNGVQYTCVDKREEFKEVEPCLQNKVDNIMKACDRQCFLHRNVTHLSTSSPIKMAAQLGGNLFTVAKQMPQLCDSLRCMMPCVEEKASKVCPGSGQLILDALLQPFDAAAAAYASAPPVIQQIVVEKLTHRCFFLFDRANLERLRRGVL